MAPMKGTKGMKGMKAMKTSMTASAAYTAVAEKTGLKPKDVKAAMEAIIDMAAKEMKKSGSFKLGGALNLKLKNKPAKKAMKGINPFTKEPCVFKAKPASKTVRAIPMKKKTKKKKQTTTKKKKKKKKKKKTKNNHQNTKK